MAAVTGRFSVSQEDIPLGNNNRYSRLSVYDRTPIILLSSDGDGRGTGSIETTSGYIGTLRIRSAGDDH